MFKTLAIAASLLAASPATAQDVRFGITIGNSPYAGVVTTRHGAYQDMGYVQCRRPNGRIGIITDHYGRPLTAWQLRRGYAYGARCLKVRPTRIYDHRYGERYEGRGY